jgi:uncharacterized protein YegP (UPF0339 family)
MTSSDDSSGGRKRLLLLAAAVLGTLGALAVAVFRLERRPETLPEDVEEAVEVAIEGGSGTETVSETETAGGGTEQVDEAADTTDTGETERTESAPASQATFECYEDGAGDWRWRLTHRNGRNLARSTRGYEDRSTLDEALDAVRKAAESGTEAFEVYEDDAGKWRWRLHGDERVLAVSSRGYGDEESAVDGTESVRRNVAGATATYEAAE